MPPLALFVVDGIYSARPTCPAPAALLGRHSLLSTQPTTMNADSESPFTAA